MGFRVDWKLSAMDILTLLGMLAVGAYVYGTLDERMSNLERATAEAAALVSQVPRIDERLTANSARDEQLRADIRSSLDEIKIELREQRRLLEDRRRERP